jgi:arsenate reductase
MTQATIYHNPSCGTSRNTLALIREAGIEPHVIEYLKAPPGKTELEALARQVGGARVLLREKAPPYAELGLAQDHWSDGQLLDFIVAHPILLNRPVVVTGRGARVCRPAETVLELLAQG